MNSPAALPIGISSYTFPWAVGLPGYIPAKPLTAFGLVEIAAASGIPVVQICDNCPLESLDNEALERLSGEAARHGITIEAGTRGTSEAHLKRMITIAKRLSSPILRVVIDNSNDRPDPQQVVERIRSVLPLLSEAEIVLAIENHDRFTAATFAQIVEQLGTPLVGICLDTVNSMGALESPQTVVGQLAKYTVNLHYKDFVIRRTDTQLGFVIEGVAAGTGMLDGVWLLESLLAHKRSFSIILEQWPQLQQTLENTIDTEYNWAVQGIAWLRKLANSVSS